ncbi:MAG: TM0106 family RecB-like putative nuclease [Acidobacteria bacterium]|nr:TM0106 family RecB-like putative nuclease [Acidobacteriota bacterium]
MRNADGRLVFSATDLSLHLACPHLTTLRRAEACGEITPPLRYDDPRAEALKQRGIEHEQRILERLAAEGRTVATITAPGAPFARQDWATAAARTADALRRGVDVVYQGRLESGDGLWSGYPDFLIRVETRSALGAWSYEAADAKLARTARGTALLQLLLYSDLLAMVQGHEPEQMHLALGGGDGHIDASFRVVEYAAYYRAVRRTFEAHADAPPETYPEPVDHCRLCDWNGHCVARRRDDDHLAQVAGITRGQRQRLVARDIPTMAALGGLSLPVDPAIDGVSPAALGRIREQARVQDAARRSGTRLHELIEPVEPETGLAALPEPSAGDLFFDLEGDAFAGEGGLEYLFGFADRDGTYEARWALDPPAEKREFERFIDSVMARWEWHPGFHIYHYAPYETTAVKRLMSRYATREEEVDKLLRGRVFVDLYRVVRQGLRASVESYSIKKLEPFYGFERDVELGEATRSLIALEVRLESGHGAGVPDELRAEIEGYNRDDCLSTLRLANWLEACRAELEARTGESVPRPAPHDEEREQERESAAEVQAVFDALVAGLPEDEEALDDEQRARRLLAYLLEFHRREDKSTWWEFFDRCGMGPEELVEHRATLGGLTYTGAVGQIKRSTVHRYRFPEQTHEIEVGDTPKNPETAETDDLQRGFCGTVFALDEAGRTIDLKRGRNSPVPHPAALVPLDTVNSKVLRESLLRLAGEVASSGFAPDSPRRAAFDLLLRVPPRLGAVAPPGAGSSRDETAPPGGPRVAAPARLGTTGRLGVESPPGETAPPPFQGSGPVLHGEAAPPLPESTVVARGEAPLDTVRRIAPRLDRSVLPVQGPPGSGKTYTGARMILDLLADGKRVGVTANSHKVISNLLDAVCRAADADGGRTGRAPGSAPADAESGESSRGHETGGPSGAATTATVRGIQKVNAGDGCPDERITQADSNDAVAEALESGEANLAGGTAWLWAREEMADAVDVLVIDEAGQMSLANTLAVCHAARSLVLLGDPRQLDQPIQGVHPPGADVSALGHLLGEAATVDPSRGVFLDRTWRMHPDVCAFTSEQFYEGRLGTRPDLARQAVLGPGPLPGHGLRDLPVEPSGPTHASEEEAAYVAALTRELLDAGAAWVDRNGAPHPLTLQDILVVAPYNAQVAALRAALPDGARVGTVDKFQGQEAPIVLYSMATSSAADAPRGMEFLYSLHRLNVATSRARCVAAIVASPALLTPDCRTPEQMRLANPFCRFLELARPDGRVGSLRGRSRLHRMSAAQTPGAP